MSYQFAIATFPEGWERMRPKLFSALIPAVMSIDIAVSSNAPVPGHHQCFLNYCQHQAVSASVIVPYACVQPLSA
jgi:hypothetical protein